MLTLQINGQVRTVDVPTPANLAQVLAKLEIQPDRVAVELDGDIASKATWETTAVVQNARLEIVHFVGGGSF
jgi:thiamine biosynthesis protein ThiS